MSADARRPAAAPDEAAFQSFTAQVLHYFQRPHEGVPDEPVDGPAAWRGEELARHPERWTDVLDDAAVAELEAAGRAVQARGLPLGRVHREDFPLPTLAPRIRSWADELRDGRGFLRVRGLPVGRWGDDFSALVYWGIGQHLGRPGAQNPAGELLGHVTDTGEEATNPHVRRYRTAGDIAFHCDLADVVGLLCLRTARRGGASRIASSVAIHDTILRERPDLLVRLYEPFMLDSRDEQRPGARPFLPVHPCRYGNGRLSFFWHTDYFGSVTRHPEAPPFTAAEREILALVEELAGSDALRLDMQFEPGDVQLLSNHTVVHARGAYEDDPAAPRHLLRLWLSLDR